ncbi:DEAD/DEAH box helicase [Salinifilum ghardaiensis]
MPTFDELDLDPEVLKTLVELGYETPTPIQERTIPPLLEGNDVLGLAQTGTGKTAAFALPILSTVNVAEQQPQALVLCPTRELAIQVSDAIQSYATGLDGLRVLSIYGGQSYRPQLEGLRRGPHVVVGTPGRVIDHLNRGTLDLSGLEHVVLDEADEMLRMGFVEDVETILSSAPAQRRTALFSATMPPAVRRISQSYMREPVEVTVESSTRTAATVNQRYLSVRDSAKRDALTRVLEAEQCDGVIVFVRTKQLTEELAEYVQARGFRATAINGDVPQQLRERTIGQLRDGKVDILVATDVAARGLDVERISHVFNYDIPRDREAYVHRVGRTGRAGRTGEAILFVSPRERGLLRGIEKSTGQTITPMQLPTVEEVNKQRLARFAAQITDTLGSGDLEVFEDLVRDYQSEHDADPVRIAAALASMAQGDRPLLLDPSDELETPDFESNKSDKETYRVEVGRRNRVTPKALVGALANEGGLASKHIGNIDIRAEHTLVELPADLPEQLLRKLGRTQVAGRGLHISRADDEVVGRRGGRPNRSRGTDRGRKSGAGPRKEGRAGRFDKRPRRPHSTS